MAQNKNKFVIVFVVVALLLGGYFAYESYMYETTDNAQVDAHTVLLASRINGTIQKVNADENQKVKAGDVLAEIDPADFVTAAEAAEAQVASLQARFHEAEKNYQRATDLFKTQAISRERFDNAQASFKELEAKLKAAQAQYEAAKLNLSYTKIVAPSDGTISRRSAEVGQTVQPGQALFGFVQSGDRWVTANLKETQLDHLRPGLPVKIAVDALSGKTFRGEVESIAPSTGATFSLLPPDNATGNFTKVVQRVPVRIKFLQLTDEDRAHLQAGLSAYVWIQVH